MAGKSITHRRSPNNKTPAAILEINPSGKLDMGTQWTFQAHRSGWPVVLKNLFKLHNPKGVIFDGFVDQTFAWYRKEAVTMGEIPYVSPWAGFLHNPPNIPGFYERMASPEVFLNSYYMQKSLEYCKGLVVLSDYLKAWLEPQVDCPVERFFHPTQTPNVKFNWTAYKANQDKKIIQLGFWLRKLHSLKHLNAPKFRKVWLVAHEHAIRVQEMESNSIDIFNREGLEVVGKYEEWDRVNDREYDYLLSNNISFLDLYDASANNAVIECIVRNTPLLVRKHPAVVEYLGADYPFYFDSLDEASDKLENEDSIYATHRYLAEMDKRSLDPEYFLHSFKQSDWYQSLEIYVCDEPFQVGYPRLDTLDSLNLIHGKPLEAEYVFVITFRNQESKLIRCLDSVLPQCEDYDAGIILIDDNSEDIGLELAVEYLGKSNVDYVAVRNLERKFFTQNLYNAVNLLVTSEDVVIIEVDGDDYLEDTDVLRSIHREYEQGARKTFGSFRMAPGAAKIPGMDQITNPKLVSVVSDPWNLENCLAWIPVRTYKKELFMEVPLRYFWERSGKNWLKTGEDFICHALMTAIAGEHAHYIEKVLYVYDNTGVHHDQNLVDRPRYILENLYRLPTGLLIGEYWEQYRNGKFVHDVIGPRITSKINEDESLSRTV